MEVKNLKDHSCPKTQGLVNSTKNEEKQICSSYPFQPKIRLHYAERNVKLFPN